MIWPLRLLASALGFGQSPREIFQFFDGRRMRRVDPLALMRAIHAHSTFSLDKLDDVTASGSLLGGSDKAEEWFHETVLLTANAARELFRVKSLEEGGLADHECVRLMFAFRDYLEGLKRPFSQRLTPQPSTDAISNESGEPTTPASSLTSSSVDDSSNGEPGPLTRADAGRSESASEESPASA